MLYHLSALLSCHAKKWNGEGGEEERTSICHMRRKRDEKRKEKKKKRKRKEINMQQWHNWYQGRRRQVKKRKTD